MHTNGLHRIAHLLQIAFVIGISSIYADRAFASDNVSHELADRFPGLFLIQMRCTTTGAMPGDTDCGPLIPLQAGQDPGYRLSNGANGTGRIDSINIPVIRNGKWRVVSPDVHINASDPSQQGGVSIEGIGPQYLSIMGSWSPVATSFFVDAHCSQMPESSNRFLDAWVLGQAHGLSSSDASGVTSSNNLTGTSGQGCPEKYRSAAFTWEHTVFNYRSGRRLDSLISVHYSSADTQGLPGSAEQRERIYLAWGLGMARWEKWSRDDWSDVKTGRSALIEARSVFSSGRCSQPVDDVNTGNGVTYGPITTNGSYAENIIEGPGQASHTWYVTQCQDYTSLISGPTQDLINLANQASSIFWQ